MCLSVVSVGRPSVTTLDALTLTKQSRIAAAHTLMRSWPLAGVVAGLARVLRCDVLHLRDAGTRDSIGARGALGKIVAGPPQRSDFDGIAIDSHAMC